MYLMLQNCAYKIIKKVMFYVMCILPPKAETNKIKNREEIAKMKANLDKHRNTRRKPNEENSP